MDHHRFLVIFTFKSSLSLSNLHLQVIFIWIWIITRSGSSSLDLDHHSIWIISGASSLDLDHPSIWIISVGSSSLDLHGCYLMILLIIGISTDPTLFHARCRPSHHVVLHPALTSDHVGTNPIIILESHTQHSHLTMWEHLPQPCQKGPALTFDTCEEPIQHGCSKRIFTYI